MGFTGYLDLLVNVLLFLGRRMFFFVIISVARVWFGSLLVNLFPSTQFPLHMQFCAELFFASKITLQFMELGSAFVCANY